jgi:hypothetical protein
LVDERHGTSKGGKAWTIREQGAYAHVLDKDGKAAKYPVATKINLEPDAAPYQPGFYTLDPRSIFVGDFQQMQLGRVKLMPLKSA